MSNHRPDLHTQTGLHDLLGAAPFCRLIRRTFSILEIGAKAASGKERPAMLAGTCSRYDWKRASR